MKNKNAEGKKRSKFLTLFITFLIVIVLSVFGYNEIFTDNTDETVTSSVVSDYSYSEYETETTYIVDYHFRNESLLSSHYEKHGKEMGFALEDEYEDAASDVINSPKALSKYESDENDGDMVYFIKNTGEIVFLSSDGYIRTYFVSDEDYFNRQ